MNGGRLASPPSRPPALRGGAPPRRARDSWGTRARRSRPRRSCSGSSVRSRSTWMSPRRSARSATRVRCRAGRAVCRRAASRASSRTGASSSSSRQSSHQALRRDRRRSRRGPATPTGVSRAIGARCRIDVSSSSGSRSGPPTRARAGRACGARAARGQRRGVLGGDHPQLQLVAIGGEQLFDLARYALCEDQRAQPQARCLQGAVEGAPAGLARRLTAPDARSCRA